MTDLYLRYANSVQALRRRASAMNISLGGALGVAASPMPHQLATVRRVLGASEVRYLLSDEVGLGKTVQALMIINALRWQDPSHRTILIAPDNLLSQWQEECWVRGHMVPSLAGNIAPEQAEDAPITLVRPRDLINQGEELGRAIDLDASQFDLLVVDEPQTMTREALQQITQASASFRQVLVLSATPRLGDPSWREPILRILEPEAGEAARLQDRTVDDVLAERESLAINALNDESNPVERERCFMRASVMRRVVRNGRKDWSDYLPERRNHIARIDPLRPERLRFDIAEAVLDGLDPADGFQGQAWTIARRLQRSARTAREALAVLASRGGELGEKAEQARVEALENPGDSRLDMLLDVLSAQWSEDPERTFVIVCGDNPTIDMLRAALPRYFADLADRISVLRRPAGTEQDSVDDLRKIQETLAPMLEGESRLLLVGEWVQAGLNLHHVAHGVIFFSLPWEIDTIDQLIGRVDRLGRVDPKTGKPRPVDIWRLLVNGSQEAAIADHAADLGVFDAPLPPLPPEELEAINAEMGRAAMTRSPGRATVSHTGNFSISSRLADASPYGPERAKREFEVWLGESLPGPVLLGDVQRTDDTPVRKEERSIGGWLKTIGVSSDFDISGRRDKIDDYSFQTIWYHAAGGRGRASNLPFLLPGASVDNWMTGHLPFIHRRSNLSTPPRKGVHTDEGERSDGGTMSARPLRFLDHGGELHDALVAGYRASGLKLFGEGKRLVQTAVRLPEEHPAWEAGSPVMISVALFDPFPDDLLPPLFSKEAMDLFNATPEGTQKAAQENDRKALLASIRALQRRVRMEIPARLARVGAVKGPVGWTGLSDDLVDNCLTPLSMQSGKTIARGHSSVLTPKIPEQSEELRARLTTQLRSEHERFRSKMLDHVHEALEEQSIALFSKYHEQLKNREAVLERRRNTPPGNIPIELWRGQIAGLERSVSATQLGRTELMDYLQELVAGRMRFPQPDVMSIILTFAHVD